MGFFNKLFSRRSGEVSTSTLDQWDDFWYTVVGQGSSSGAMVSKLSAMRQWTVYACITEISQTLAQLPLKLKRPAESGGTEDAKDHPLYDLCKSSPNPLMSSFIWRESQQANLLTTGNNYNFIERNRLGVKGIWPLDPESVTPRRANNQDINQFRLSKNDRVVYDVKTTTGVKTYPAKDILHIVGFGWNGLIGESVITNFAKESIGNAIVIDQFQGKAMKNGYYPSGILEHPSRLGETKESFVKALDQRYAGPENVKRPMILEDGMKFNKVDVSMVDKQFIEQMKMSATQICGIFKVPPHRVSIYEKNTNYNNTEQGNKSFLDSCMQQWVVRWEQEMARRLLTRGEREEGYYFKFNFDALLRPDAKTRSEIQWREWQTGVPLNVIRKRNDENPVEGGDVGYVPVNMIPYHLAGAKIESEIEAQNVAKEDLLDADIDALKSLEKNSVVREAKRQQRKRSSKPFDEAVDDIYKKLFEKIDTRIRLLVRSFNDEISTSNIIAELKRELNERKSKVSQLQKSNLDYIEVIFDEE